MITHRQHLLMAAIIWTMVAVMLTIRGIMWIVSNMHFHDSVIFGFTLVAIFGLLKGRFVLSGTANRMISHIENLNECSPFWKIYTPRMYWVVLLMICIGILCRLAGAYWHIYWIIGYLYSVIGIALFTGSGVFWHAWNRYRQKAQ
ncbi:MAG: hypothetical protein ACYC0V_08210 [Armatimonadota bacterium]